MDTLDTLLGHRSIREYRDEAIPDATLAAILEAATRASTSGNMQTYSILVTKDAERRRRLWELHFEQDMVLQAPVILTFCVDWHRMNRWCRLSDAAPGYGNLHSFLVGFSDAVIAAQNAAIAAESFGLGICYMGTTLARFEELIDFFELPEGVLPATTMVVGRPAEDPDVRARLPRDGIVFDERYPAMSDERIREIYRDRETEGWKRYMSIPDLAKEMLETGVENLAQVYTELKYTKEDNEKAAREQWRTLGGQGFGDER